MAAGDKEPLIRKVIWPLIGLVMGVTLIVLFYPITLHNFIIGIITGIFSGLIARFLVSIQNESEANDSQNQAGVEAVRHS